MTEEGARTMGKGLGQRERGGAEVGERERGPDGEAGGTKERGRGSGAGGGGRVECWEDEQGGWEHWSGELNSGQILLNAKHGRCAHRYTGTQTGWVRLFQLQALLVFHTGCCRPRAKPQVADLPVGFHQVVLAHPTTLTPSACCSLTGRRMLYVAAMPPCPCSPPDSSSRRPSVPWGATSTRERCPSSALWPAASRVSNILMTV